MIETSDQSSRVITVNSRKYDGSLHRSWQGGLLSQQDTSLVLVGTFDRDVEHAELGLISRGTLSFEHFWLDRWYNVFRFYEPDGRFRNYYCNIGMPPVLSADVLDFVDLDLDIVVRSDLKCEILDRDDFEQNAVKYGYPDVIRGRAEAALAELMVLIEERQTPFHDLADLARLDPKHIAADI
jgi:uncharacterized protein